MGGLALQAQNGSSISGKVVDATGATISGAMVSIKNVETGASRDVVTSDDGSYLVLALPVGQYQVHVQKNGFKEAIRSGINLAVGQQAVVNVQVEVGPIAQAVTVSGEAQLINTTTDPVSGLVSERQIKDLPLNGRSFDNLITLNPSAINYELKSNNTSTSNGSTFSVDGHRPLDNLTLLNGIEYTGSSQLAVTPGGVSGELLGIDAVREFNVLTDTYSAEYGKRSGAQVLVVTQSGANVLHGSLFEFLRNSDLDARNFFDQNRVPPFRRNQFGGSLGAPIKKDKLFVFGNYEGFRQSLALSNVTVVPDAEARQGLLPNATTGIYAPVANLNKNMLQYMSFWPQQNGPELYSNGVPSGIGLSYNNPLNSIHENFGTLRTDYLLGPRDTLSAAYTIDDGTSLIPQSDPLFASNLALRMQVASLQETHIVSPQTLNTFTAGFSRAGWSYSPIDLTPISPSLSFVSGEGAGGIVVGGGVTTTANGTITSAGPNNASNVWNRRNLFTFADSMQMTKGRHQLSYGVWFQRVQDNEDTASRQLGQASFASLTTFLQGTVTTFQAVPIASELGFRSLFSAGFVQDVIKLRPNLTLRVGVRLESTTGWNEVDGRGSNYIPNAQGIIQTAPIVGNSVFTKNNATHLFSPRVGLAWDPFGNGKTAVRAGFGTYYSLIDALSFLLNSLPPYNTSISCPGSLFSIIPIVRGAPTPSNCSVAPQGVQADAQTPTVEEWNFTVERQLDSNTSLRAAYVGSHGYHGMLSIDPNDIPAQICSTASGCTAGGTATTAASESHVAQGAQYIPVGTRPNPALGAGFFWYTEGNSSYNALQLDATRRLTNGFQLRANFTWSKNLDMNSGLTGAQSANQAQMILDRNDLPRDWGPSALNVAYQSSISAHYELPFGQGKRWLNSNGVSNKFVGGWQLNEIATLLSGFPFTPQDGSNRSGDGDTRNPDRPNLNPSFSGPVVTGNPNQWFNPNAFVLNPFGTYGNVGRGVYSGPGLADLDLSVMKNTSLSERINLQFRAEMFNILNHPNFGTPNAIVFSGTTFSSSAGLITSTATTSRQIQFGLKLMF